MSMFFLDQNFTFFRMMHLRLLQVPYYVEENGGNYSRKRCLHSTSIFSLIVHYVELSLQENQAPFERISSKRILIGNSMKNCFKR
jgi:hypothetical protein